MRSYSNYKFIISISIFNRMALWRTLCLQSNIKEVLCLHFIFPFLLVLFFFFIFLIYIFYLLIILWGIPLIIK